MIFAIVYWVKYRTQRGRYSDESVGREGGKRATHSNFPDASKYAVGDLVFLHPRNSFISWVVMYYTSGIWSHTAIVSENGHVIDATLAGVVEHPFNDYIDGQSFISVRTFKIPLSQFQKDSILQFMRSQIGAGYNWMGVVRLWSAIALGVHANYRVCFSADIVIVLWCLFLFGHEFPWVKMVSACVGLTYVAVVILTTPLRRAMRVRLEASTEPGSL